LVSLWLNAQFAQFLRQPLGALAFLLGALLLLLAQQPLLLGALAFLLRTLMLLLGSRTLLLTQ
jgi:hypothetical protein